MFTVSVTIPDLGGDTHEEAAEVFWQVLDEYRQGALGNIYVDVRGEPDTGASDFPRGVIRVICVEPTTGRAVKP